MKWEAAPGRVGKIHIPVHTIILMRVGGYFLHSDVHYIYLNLDPLSLSHLRNQSERLHAQRLSYPRLSFIQPARQDLWSGLGRWAADLVGAYLSSSSSSSCEFLTSKEKAEGENGLE